MNKENFKAYIKPHFIYVFILVQFFILLGIIYCFYHQTEMLIAPSIFINVFASVVLIRVNFESAKNDLIYSNIQRDTSPIKCIFSYAASLFGPLLLYALAFGMIILKLLTGE